ncbi:MAG: hypothetical protein M1826_001706 [Phylliscum demangeonii]|nr:MAG: hypothetical protein M1826_001706 [Phylliscum demangeonii]
MESSHSHDHGRGSRREHFYRQFQQDVHSLQQQITRLEDAAKEEAAKENDEKRRTTKSTVVEDCMAAITKLSEDVNDGRDWLPAYDQRSYAETIKALADKLQLLRAARDPKPKFSFKSARREGPMTARVKAVVGPRAPGGGGGDGGGGGGGGDGDGPSSHLLLSADASSSSSSPSSRLLEIADRLDESISLVAPVEPAPSSGLLTRLRRCVVDLLPRSTTPSPTTPLATLTVKDIHDSLVVCGTVQGPAHITQVHHSTVVVVHCRQFRLHECRDVDVYLSCASRPIIEDCVRVRFAPLAACLGVAAVGSLNQWDQVDDFRWLRAAHSPNWSVLPVEERVPEAVWLERLPLLLRRPSPDPQPGQQGQGQGQQQQSESSSGQRQRQQQRWRKKILKQTLPPRENATLDDDDDDDDDDEEEEEEEEEEGEE